MTLRPNAKLSKAQRTALEEKYLRQFLTEAVTFYDNPELLQECFFECKISGRMTTALASLEHFGKIGRASNRTLHNIPNRIILRIARKTLDLPDSDIAKIIRHEVIHIGHLNHGRIFKELCVKFNASFKGWNLSGQTEPSFQVQLQKGYGTRFKTIAECETYDEALIEMKTALITRSGTQLRIRSTRKATIEDLGGY